MHAPSPSCWLDEALMAESQMFPKTMLGKLPLQPEHGRIEVSSWWLVSVFPVLVVVAITIPYDVIYHLTYFWGWFLLFSWAWVRYQGPRVSVGRELQSTWAQVGDELVEQWHVHNGSRLPLLWLQVDDQSTFPGYHTRRVVAAAARRFVRWQTTAVCKRRGRYHLGPLVIELGDPLGVFRYRRVVGSMREMLIYPPIAHLPTLERPRGERGGTSRTSLLNIGPTPNVAAVRDYQPGDPMRHIHWRSVAHNRKLMVKQFDQDIAGTLWIVLDMAADVHSGEDEVSTEELAVILACSMANQLLMEGRTVGLYAHGAQQHLVRLGRGTQHLWECMRMLIDVRADGSLPLRTVIDELGALSTVRNGMIVITPDLRTDWLLPLAGLTGIRDSLALLVLPNDQASSSAPPPLERLGIPHMIFRTGDSLRLSAPPKAWMSATSMPTRGDRA